MTHSSLEDVNASNSECEQPDSLSDRQHSVDPGLLEVVLAMAALSVAIVVIPFELSDLVHQWLAVPVAISAVISFILSYMCFGDLYSEYLSQKGRSFPGWWFGRKRMAPGKIRLDPYWELWMAIRFFGISLALLLAGIALNWLMDLFK